MTLSEIRARAETATAEEQRGLLIAGYAAVFGNEEDNDERDCLFLNKLDAKAYIDAALMLLPERCDEWLIKFVHGRYRAIVWRPSRSVGYGANAATPDLALLAAICAAMEGKD